MKKHEALEELQRLGVENSLRKEWLSNFLYPHCKIKRIGKRATDCKMVQIPNEFADFLLFMVKEQVKSYLEIGVSSGGSWFFAHQFLTLHVPGFSHSEGVDMRSSVQDSADFFGKFKNATFTSMMSKNFRLNGRRFDMAFIDARHNEKNVLRDYSLVVGGCRFVAFHDIVLQGASVDVAWKQIKSKHKEHWEFIDYSIPEHARCGIGIVKV